MPPPLSGEDVMYSDCLCIHPIIIPSYCHAERPVECRKKGFGRIQGCVQLNPGTEA